MMQIEVAIPTQRGAFERSRQLKILMDEAATKYWLRPETIKGRNRRPEAIKARRELWYRAHMLDMGLTIEQLALWLNRKNHETVRMGIAVHCVENNLPFPDDRDWWFWIERRGLQRKRWRK